MRNYKKLTAALVTTGAFLMASLAGCVSAQRKPSSEISKLKLASQILAQDNEIIKSDYKKNEITELCRLSLKEAQDRIESLVAQPSLAPNVLLFFEETLADLSDRTSPLVFMGYVSTNADLRKEGMACNDKASQFGVELFTRKDVYQILKNHRPLTTPEKRLHSETLKAFERNGLDLPDTKLAELKNILKQIEANKTQFSANLNNDNTKLIFTADDLRGVPDSFLARAEKNKSGSYVITTKSSDYTVIMENAQSPLTREKMLLAFLQRGTPENTNLLEKTIQLRSQAAKILGFETWVDYQAQNRMAKSRKNIEAFLLNLKSKLAAKNKSDLDKIRPLKKVDDPGVRDLSQSDIMYYMNQYRKTKLNVDNEKIREYFPAETVVAGMFKIYSKILGVDYKVVENVKVWSPDVKLYEIIDQKSKVRVGYFYADLYPREGKYSHAAAFPLISGRLLNGDYNEPVSAIVSNFTPAGGGKPSLLTHREVETLFHEFGHIMHQTLTRAPYASLSGTSVANDFVEAPSQMLENWTWDYNMLQQMTGHYSDHSKKLPKDLFRKMQAAEDFGKGYFYSRQLIFGLFDLAIHTTDKANVDAIYENLFKELIGIEPIAGGRFPGTFGHMMGGYDAGYYGYLWSEVFAEDMFSLFARQGLLNKNLGLRYRRIILESGSMREAKDLLKEFLGREPNSEAFFKKLKL